MEILHNHLSNGYQVFQFNGEKLCPPERIVRSRSLFKSESSYELWRIPFQLRKVLQHWSCILEARADRSLAPLLTENAKGVGGRFALLVNVHNCSVSTYHYLRVVFEEIDLEKTDYYSEICHHGRSCQRAQDILFVASFRNWWMMHSGYSPAEFQN